MSTDIILYRMQERKGENINLCHANEQKQAQSFFFSFCSDVSAPFGEPNVCLHAICATALKRKLKMDCCISSLIHNCQLSQPSIFPFVMPSAYLILSLSLSSSVLSLTICPKLCSPPLFIFFAIPCYGLLHSSK